MEERLNVCQLVAGGGFDADGLPRDVVDSAGRVIDEVVVRRHLGVVDHPAFANDDLTKEALFDEETEGVVDSGARDERQRLARLLEDAIGAGVLIGGEDVGRHREPVRRRLDAVVAEKLVQG